MEEKKQAEVLPSGDCKLRDLLTKTRYINLYLYTRAQRMGLRSTFVDEEQKSYSQI